jgi:hypothetical protein
MKMDDDDGFIAGELAGGACHLFREANQTRSDKLKTVALMSSIKSNKG